MNLNEAVERAERDEHVQQLKGYFLCSSFATLNENQNNIKEWTLLYYSPSSKSVVDCFVSEKFVTVGEETPAVNEIQKLELYNVKIDVSDALSIAEQRFKKKPLNILMSLHKKQINNKAYTVWTLAYITPDMSATSFDIDATSGKILKEERTSLIKRM